MEKIPEKLLKFKFHIIFATLLSLLFLSLFLLAPRFLTILSYFWPLFVSTALFLIAVVFFARVSPPISENTSEKAGEGLLDYVAGQPEIVLPEQIDEEDILKSDEKSEKASEFLAEASDDDR